jgi:hypothetical protein
MTDAALKNIKYDAEYRIEAYRERKKAAYAAFLLLINDLRCTL